MKRNNRPMRYRRRGYGRRHSHLLWILPLATALVLLVGLVVAGNLLNRRNQNPADTDAPPAQSDTPAVTERTPIRDVRAYPVMLETAEAGTFSDRLAALVAAGRGEASVPLNTRDGRLLYRSQVGEQLGFVTDTDRSVTLTDALPAAKESGVYVSGVYYLTAFGEEDDLLRSVALSRSAALLAEGLRAGLNDVLLIAPDLGSEHTDELIRFLDELHALAPGSTVWLALGVAQYAAENAAWIETLYGSVDYLALEAVSPEDTDPVSALSAAMTDANIRYHLLHYHVRILIPSAADDAALAERIAIPEAEKFYNWQIVA